MSLRMTRNQVVRDIALLLRLDGLTYKAIADRIGCTPAGAYYLTRPSEAVALAVQNRADRRCEVCQKEVCLLWSLGSIHHRQVVGMTPDTYNAEANLTLLCGTCHRHAHVPPAAPRVRLSSSERSLRTSAGRLHISPDAYRERLAAGNRWCFFHKTWEPGENFGRDARLRDGVAGQCRDAVNERARRLRRQEDAA